jgi:signal transduction histidine kinase
MLEPIPNARVLVVDDDAGLLRLMGRTLEREGFAAATAASGEDALELLKEASFDLLLVDLRLSDMTGPELLERLAARGQALPFAVITGQGDERIAVELMKRGALDYLVKDAEFLDLMPTRVRRAVENLQQKKRLAESRQAVKHLQQQLLEISAREQRRIGQDLHDGLGQHLTGIELMSEALEQALARKKRPEAEQASKIARHVRDAIRQAKGLARGLSPVEVERHGLMSALNELCASTADACGAACTFDCPHPVLMEDNASATHLYRIAQEAVNNAVKHGRAKNIFVQLGRHAGSLRTLEIVNDGAPFAPDGSAGGMGLQIMRYRAATIGGRLEIVSSPGETLVRCTFKEEEA